MLGGSEAVRSGQPEPAGGAGDDPVFVLCTGRSGSTLVRFLLDAHPELACAPETKLPWLARQLAAAWAVIEDTPPPAADPADGADGGALSQPVAEGLRRSLDPMIASYLARRQVYLPVPASDGCHRVGT